jgi:hypothetical protein
MAASPLTQPVPLEQKNSMNPEHDPLRPLYTLLSIPSPVRPDDYRFSPNEPDDDWLNPMSPHPVTFDGIQFPTTEHLFQWLRFEGYPAIQDAIRSAPSPSQAREIAVEHLMAIGDRIWSETDMDALRRAMRAKLTQYPCLRAHLAATAPVRLVADVGEWAPGFHPYWGAGEVDGERHGENVAGRLWMELRDELNAPPASAASQLTPSTL